MDWEQTKENCVPVRQGRSKAALQELADTAGDALEQKRRELWAEVVNYQGDDPLEPWQRYIKWMQEFGVGGGKADLQKVLEACTKELQRHARYACDIRFLRIWIQYADCLPDPGDVFLYLREKGIGRDFALYYEAYATYFELKGNFQSADAVYTDGVQRGAKPVERLKQKHTAFQQRMAHRIQRKIQEEQELGPPAPEPVRSSLATLGGRGTGSRLQQPGQISSGGIFGAPPAQQSLMFGMRGAPPPPQQQQPRASRAPVGLLADDEFAGGENPIGLPGYSSMPQANNLRELKPYTVIRKENMDKATAWNQASLLPGAPAGGPSGGGAGGMQIFTDEEFQDGEEPPSAVSARPEPAPAPGGHPLLLPSGAGAGAHDSLMASLAPPPSLLRGGAQPGFAMQHSQQQPVASALFPSAARSASVQPVQPTGRMAAPPRAPVTAPAYAPQSNVHATVGVAGEAWREAADAEEELSYEELRAAAWLRNNPLPAARNVPVTTGHGHNAGTCGAAASTSTRAASPPLPSTCGGGHGGQAALADSQCARQAQAPCGTSAAADAIPANGGPTAPLCTARRAPFGAAPVAASLGGDAVPRQPLAGRPPTSDSAPAHEAAASAGPTAKRRAFGEAIAARAAPLSVFSDDAPFGATAGAPISVLAASMQGMHLPDGAPSSHRAAGPPAALPGAASALAFPCGDTAPTVTISTRGAFDLLNSMFSDDLPHQTQRRDTEPYSSPPQRPQQQVPVPQQQDVGASSAHATSSSQRPSVPAPRRALQPRVEAEPTLAPYAAPHASMAPEAVAAVAPLAPAPPQRHVQETSAAHEPTVTLCTREAFDALNDMFSDALPHEAARKKRRAATAEGPGGGNTKRITSSDVRRLANASLASAAGGGAASAHGACGSGPHVLGPFGGPAYGAMSAPGTSVPGAPPPLAIHEDTFFLGPAAAAMAGAGHGPTSTGPAMYEDTELLGPSARGAGHGGGAMGGGGGGGFPPAGALIHEDTEFITRPHMGHAAPSGRAAGLGARGAVGGALGRRESTTAGLGGLGAPARGAVAGRAAARPAAPARGTLQIYEDTQYI